MDTLLPGFGNCLMILRDIFPNCLIDVAILFHLTGCRHIHGAGSSIKNNFPDTLNFRLPGKQFLKIFHLSTFK